MQDLSPGDRQLLASPYFRDTMTANAREALRRAGGTIPAVTRAYGFLMQRIPHGNGSDALEAFRRVIRTMDALSQLRHTDREVLQDKVNDPWLGIVPAYQNRQLHAEQMDAIYASNPDLAALAADIEAAAEQVAAANQKQAEAFQVALDAKAQREADAAGFVASLHKRGFRLDVGANGLPRMFPSSQLTAEDRNTLATHGAELAAAITAEWTA